jgi:hypothetical protein
MPQVRDYSSAPRGGKETDNDLSQPASLIRDRLVHSPAELLLNFFELGLHPIAAGSPSQHEAAPAGLATDEGKAEEGEGFWFAEPALSASVHREASELDQAGLVGVQRQLELQ